MRLSIILPTYNVEPWIERCIRSLEDQNLPSTDYEIIVVNDGSPDKSVVIARKLAEEFKNIEIVDQKNKGLSGARNTGMKHATGNYVLFVDPDDYVAKDCLSEMLFFVEDKNLDIGMFNYNVVALKGIIKQPRSVVETKVISGIELFDIKIRDSVWKYLINRKYLTDNALYFLESMVFLEDGEFMPRLHIKAVRTAFKDIPFYFYYVRSGSIITSNIAVTDKALEGYLKAFWNLKSLQKRSDLNDIEKIFLNRSIAKFVITPFEVNATRNGLKNFSEIKQKLKNEGITTIDSKGLKGINRRRALLFNFSPIALFSYLIINNSLKSISLRIGLKKRLFYNE